MIATVLAAAFMLLLALYLLPTCIACARNHRSAGMVFLVNAFFGWSILGWIIAFTWAMAGEPERRRISPH